MQKSSEIQKNIMQSCNALIEVTKSSAATIDLLEAQNQKAASLAMAQLKRIQQVKCCRRLR
uniref:Uncharacterized protein n=1 Tax=Arundo donax TaxID=35708 RepID=A0A0A9GAD3_ARUDO